MLEVKNVTKSYGKKEVLKNISFTLKEGEILGVTGRSGIGKSTLGKILVGLEQMDSGEVFYKENKILDNNFNCYKEKDKKLRKDIQFIFQNPYLALDNKVKIKKLLLTTLNMYSEGSMTENISIVEKILEKCKLSREFLNKYPDELSGGERQRILIARALLLKPKILICDEITASLDVVTQNEILNLLLEIKEEYNISYLFITHNNRILERFCDRVITIK